MALDYNDNKSGLNLALAVAYKQNRSRDTFFGGGGNSSGVLWASWFLNLHICYIIPLYCKVKPKITLNVDIRLKIQFKLKFRERGYFSWVCIDILFISRISDTSYSAQ